MKDRDFDPPPAGLTHDNYRAAAQQKLYDHASGWKRDWVAGALGFTTRGSVFVHIVGQIVRTPKLSKHGKLVQCWLRLKAKDPRMIGRLLEIPVRIDSADGILVYRNCTAGDWISVVGSIWTGRHRNKRNFVWLLADRATIELPVVLENDRRFLRVRSDLWNQLLIQAKRTDLKQVPSPPPELPEPAEIPEEDWLKDFDELLAPPTPEPTTNP